MRSPFDFFLKSALVFLLLLAFHPVAHARKLVRAAGQANTRKINSPFGIACDAAGNLYIAVRLYLPKFALGGVLGETNRWWQASLAHPVVNRRRPHKLPGNCDYLT
jgi:hypothetical protein